METGTVEDVIAGEEVVTIIMVITDRKGHAQGQGQGHDRGHNSVQHQGDEEEGKTTLT